MAKTALVVLGVIMVLMGIWMLVPAWATASFAEPAWFAILQIVAGIIAIWVGAAEKEL